ncbi:uncharacterized protein LOC135110961 [Scylla paramamosain]|uniref:uncharacterized protein LOC135110961 n=1 Tax=Scylla paramamosain TaxID=85552 RepID=UPI00308387D4
MGKERFLEIICLVALSAHTGEASIGKIIDKGLEIGYELYEYLGLRPPILGQPVYGAPVYGPPVYGPPVYGPPVYASPEHHSYHEDVDFPVNPGTLWNGHIPVGDFVSPIAQALGAGQGSYNNRVVKGYENRLGLRIALPYLGDFQVTRELGPGRFLDKLGPGKFPYPGMKGAQGYGHHHKDSSEHHHSSSPPAKHPTPDMYKGLQNYPWHRR